MKEQIIEIIRNLTGYNNIDDETDLLEEDILDSLAFIEMIEEIENAFDIEIQPTLVPDDTWKNVDNIVKMVEELKSK